MTTSKTLLATFVASFAVFATASAQDTRIWNNNAGNDNWSNASNWDSGVPDTNTEIAEFDGSVGSNTVTVDQNFTINRINFTAASPGYTLNGSNTLTLDGNSPGTFTTAVLNESASDQTINNNIIITNTAGGAAGTLFTGNAASTTIYNGTLTANAVINFGGFGNTNVNGNVVNNNGLRFGTAASASVTFAGAGTTSGTGGNINFFAGIINLNRSSSVTGSGYLVNNATINLGAANAIGSVGNLVVLSGGGNGSLNTGGFDATFAVLDVDNNFAIDLGDGDSDLVFADSSGQIWDGTALTIAGYTEGVDSIRFGTDINGLTMDQLNKITVNGIGGITLDSDGFIVVPEPSAIALTMGIFVGALCVLRRNRRQRA